MIFDGFYGKNVTITNDYVLNEYGMKKKPNGIYLIGSLKNENIPIIARELREILKIEVFDDWFSPGPDADDYWRQYEKTRGSTYKQALSNWAGKHVFEFDKHHIDRLDIGVLVMPAGKSAHLELGYMLGQHKRGYVFFDKEPERWDVMYQFATNVFFNKEELIDELIKVVNVNLQPIEVLYKNNMKDF